MAISPEDIVAFQFREDYDSDITEAWGPRKDIKTTRPLSTAESGIIYRTTSPIIGMKNQEKRITRPKYVTLWLLFFRKEGEVGAIIENK